MIPYSFLEWVKMMSKIGWAHVLSNLYWLRNPLKYVVLTKSTVCFHGKEDVLSEEINFVGVVRDVPDVTPHSIIHKWVMVKTFYGEWEE